MMWADTSHVVSVVTVLSNGTSKVSFPLRYLLDRCNSTQLWDAAMSLSVKIDFFPEYEVITEKQTFFMSEL